jgi:DNA-binding PadR family transcriptional regulator
MTLQTRLVLRELFDGRELYGLDLCDRTHLPSGTIYPILSRLERAGWVESAWEEARVQETEHRPRRRYYRMTPSGYQLTREALASGYRGGRKVGQSDLDRRGAWA